MGDPKYAPQAKYQSEKCTGIFLKLVKSTDADILEHLSSQPNRQGYIKALIRADIQKSQENQKKI